RRLHHEVLRPGGAEHLARSLDRVIEHATTVLAQTIADPRGRNAVRIRELGIERDAVLRLGQVLTDRRDPGRVIEQLAIAAMVFGSGRNLARGHTEHGGRDRTEAAKHLERVTADEAARQIGLVELVAPDAAAGRPLVALERLVEDRG